MDLVIHARSARFHFLARTIFKFFIGSKNNDLFSLSNIKSINASSRSWCPWTILYSLPIATTMDFDETRIYYSHQALQKERGDDDNPQQAAANDNDEEQVDLNAVRRHFREFLSESM